jgi:hypothetical protein
MLTPFYVVKAYFRPGRDEGEGHKTINISLSMMGNDLPDVMGQEI